MLVREVSTKLGDIYLIPGDIHFDAQDDSALSIMVDVAVARRVNGTILVGDTFDSAGISRHGRPGRKFRFGRATLASEGEAARPWLSSFRAIVRSYRDRPGGLHMLTGNHEAWWELVQDEYPGFLDTDWPQLYGDVLDGWHVHAEHTALKLGPLLVCHGHRLRGALSRASASAVLANYPGQNTLYGHTHRVDSSITPSYKYGVPVRHGAWSIGNMRDVREELKDRALGPHAERHLQGFALVSFHEVEGELRFQVEQVTIDRKPSGAPYCIVGGVLYD